MKLGDTEKILHSSYLKSSNISETINQSRGQLAGLGAPGGGTPTLGGGYGG